MLILQVLNQRNGLKAAEVANETSIPRPTVYRLLETLEGLGFVSRDHSSEKWRPTLQAKSLSSGFRYEDWVTQSAVPEMVRLGRDILWPLDLVTFNDYRMEIRESTHNISPYSIDHGMVGLQSPVLDTAGGRAWLAFSSEEVRAQTLAGLKARQSLHDPVMLLDGPLVHVLKTCTELGVGYRMNGHRPRTQSISAPIYYGQDVLACLTVIWTTSALSFDKALIQYKDKLVQAAQNISASLARVDD